MRTRRLLLELTPLRHSRDLRRLLSGQSISLLGTQLTMVAVPYQVYELTRSSLDVGLTSSVQIVPLVLGSVVGGSIADSADRRRLVLVAETLMALCSVGLACNAALGRALWPLFVIPAVAAGFSGLAESIRNAMVPNLIGRADIATANAMFQVLDQTAMIVGPAIAGLLLAGPGIEFIYWVDAASFATAIVGVFLMAPQRPAAASLSRPGLGSIIEGLRFVRSCGAVQGAFVIDVNATVFGLPRALFPALALVVFHGGASTVGFLYAAPGVGALLGALTTGWVGRIRSQGRAVIIAVVVWGLAITAFGFVSWLPAGLALLAVAGWADVISAVFRSTIIQLSVPDALRGRLSAFQVAVVNSGPRLGDLESGAVAAGFGTRVSVVSGGLGCVVGAMVIARLLPELCRQRATPELTE